jgi:hypothetical protein
METKRILNIYERDEQLIEIRIPVMAYMDDINFLMNDKEEMEKILDIADEFHDLNDIQINKEKSELLLRSSN